MCFTFPYLLENSEINFSVEGLIIVDVKSAIFPPLLFISFNFEVISASTVSQSESFPSFIGFLNLAES